MYVRVRPETVGRLVRVLLTDVDETRRLRASRDLRDELWHELGPDEDARPPSRGERWRALTLAILIERAALHPSSTEYLLPEEARNRVLGC